MDVVTSREDWSSSSTLDSPTGIPVEFCNFNQFNGTDFIPQQFLQENVFPSFGAGDPADHGYGPPLNALEQLAGDPADHGYGPPLNALEQLVWEPEKWEPEEELEVLSEEEMQQFWEPVVEVQAPPEEQQVHGPPQAEAVVDAPETMHPNSEFSAVNLSRRIQETGSQNGDIGDDGQPAAEIWNAAYEESNAEKPPPGFASRVEDALFRVVPPGRTVGITFHKKNNVWEAHIWIKGVTVTRTVSGRKKKGVQIFLGTFATAKEAAYAHDRAAIKIRTSFDGKPYLLNYPVEEQAEYMEKHSDWSQRDFIWRLRRLSLKFSKGESELKGVSVRRRSLKRGREKVVRYEAKVSQTALESVDGKKETYMLGLFKSEEEAGREYDLALLFLHSHLPEVELLGCITNFRPSSYLPAEIEDMRRKLVR